jgi:hypothetical protein
MNVIAAGGAITEMRCPMLPLRPPMPPPPRPLKPQPPLLASTPADSYVLTREAAMVAIAKKLPEKKAPL